MKSFQSFAKKNLDAKIFLLKNCLSSKIFVIIPMKNDFFTTNFPPSLQLLTPSFSCT